MAAQTRRRQRPTVSQPRPLAAGDSRKERGGDGEGNGGQAVDDRHRGREQADIGAARRQRAERRHADMRLQFGPHAGGVMPQAVSENAADVPRRRRGERQAAVPAQVPQAAEEQDDMARREGEDGAVDPHAAAADEDQKAGDGHDRLGEREDRERNETPKPRQLERRRERHRRGRDQDQRQFERRRVRLAEIGEAAMDERERGGGGGGAPRQAGAEGEGDAPRQVEPSGGDEELRALLRAQGHGHAEQVGEGDAHRVGAPPLGPQQPRQQALARDGGGVHPRLRGEQNAGVAQARGVGGAAHPPRPAAAVMAEGVGFEPTVRKAHNGFRDRPVRPLRHPSAAGLAAAPEGRRRPPRRQAGRFDPSGGAPGAYNRPAESCSTPSPSAARASTT